MEDRTYEIFAATCDAGGKPRAVDFDEALKLLETGPGPTWMHVLAHDRAASFELLTKTFGFHPFQVEDALSDGDRADVIAQNGLLFVSVPVVVSNQGKEEYHELAIFLTERSVISVTRVPIEVVRRRFEQWMNRSIPMEETPAGILHGLIDAVVDAYFPVSDQLGEELDDLEEAVFDRARGIEVRDALDLKKRLLEFRRRITPLRDAINGLLRRDSALIPGSMWAYFHDCYDQAMRLVETTDLDRDILTSILDAHLSVVSNRLNEVMRAMTIIATVLMSVTLVASIYGMNFKAMPELQQPWGYPAALSLMAVIALVELWLFRRKGWL